MALAAASIFPGLYRYNNAIKYRSVREELAVLPRVVPIAVGPW